MRAFDRHPMDAPAALAYCPTQEDRSMRITDHRLWLPALAFLALACAPCHRRFGPYGPGMAMACGHEACGYQSKCFSEGAIHSNDGVCQACTGGKWVPATGCQECACHGCGSMMGRSSSPCEHEHPHPRRK
jgi:hypothetical protein